MSVKFSMPHFWPVLNGLTSPLTLCRHLLLSRCLLQFRRVALVSSVLDITNIVASVGLTHCDLLQWRRLALSPPFCTPKVPLEWLNSATLVTRPGYGLSQSSATKMEAPICQKYDCKHTFSGLECPLTFGNIVHNKTRYIHIANSVCWHTLLQENDKIRLVQAIKRSLTNTPIGFLWIHW